MKEPFKVNGKLVPQASSIYCDFFNIFKSHYNRVDDKEIFTALFEKAWNEFKHLTPDLKTFKELE